jgi:hypothetical protein
VFNLGKSVAEQRFPLAAAKLANRKKSNRVNDYMPVYLWLPHCARHPAKIATSCQKKDPKSVFFAKQSCSSMSERAASFFEDFHASNSGFIPRPTGCF